MSNWFVFKNIEGLLVTDYIIEAGCENEAVEVAKWFTGIKKRAELTNFGFYMIGYDRLIDAVVFNEEAELVTERTDEELMEMIEGGEEQ